MRTRNFWAVPFRQEGFEYGLFSGKRPNRKDALRAAVFFPNKKQRAHAKGSELELKVAKAFNDWLYGGEKVLRRTPLSGGWGPGLGDLSMDPHTKGKRNVPDMYVECKRQDIITGEGLLSFLLNGKSETYGGWLNKAIKDAGNDRLVFLIVQGKLMDPIVLLHATLDTFGSRPEEETSVERLQGCYVFPLRRLEDLGEGARQRILNGHSREKQRD